MRHLPASITGPTPLHPNNRADGSHLRYCKTSDNSGFALGDPTTVAEKYNLISYAGGFPFYMAIFLFCARNFAVPQDKS